MALKGKEKNVCLLVCLISCLLVYWTSRDMSEKYEGGFLNSKIEK